MARIFVTRTVPGDAVETLEGAGHRVEVWPGELPPPADVLADRAASCEALLTMVTDPCDAGLLEQAGPLRIVANMAVGYDNIDAATAARLGIWASNTPGVLAETTADLAFALLLGGARHVAAADRSVRAGEWRTWSPTAWLGVDVFRGTLGIIGLGEIGEAVARRARGFEMTILYHSRTRKPDVEAELGLEWCELDALLQRSDFVSVHTPLTDATRHLLGEREFGLMQPHALLVNTARGQVVDQSALVRALEAGQIGGAALDVTDPEPLPASDALLGLPNVTILPHIGSAGYATRARMADMAVENILAVLAGGRPPNAVNEPPQPKE